MNIVLTSKELPFLENLLEYNKLDKKDLTEYENILNSHFDDFGDMLAAYKWLTTMFKKSKITISSEITYTIPDSISANSELAIKHLKKVIKQCHIVAHNLNSPCELSIFSKRIPDAHYFLKVNKFIDDFKNLFSSNFEPILNCFYDSKLWREDEPKSIYRRYIHTKLGVSQSTYDSIYSHFNDSQDKPLDWEPLPKLYQLSIETPITTMYGCYWIGDRCINNKTVYLGNYTHRIEYVKFNDVGTFEEIRLRKSNKILS
jgi:hypothetical protein